MDTELEIMRHPKNYLDQLANGRNPLTGKMPTRVWKLADLKL